MPSKNVKKDEKRREEAKKRLLKAGKKLLGINHDPIKEKKSLNPAPDLLRIGSVKYLRK